jgi:hypothetical protein
MEGCREAHVLLRTTVSWACQSILIPSMDVSVCSQLRRTHIVLGCSVGGHFIWTEFHDGSICAVLCCTRSQTPACMSCRQKIVMWERSIVSPLPLIVPCAVARSRSLSSSDLMT